MCLIPLGLGNAGPACRDVLWTPRMACRSLESESVLAYHVVPIFKSTKNGRKHSPLTKLKGDQARLRPWGGGNRSC